MAYMNQEKKSKIMAELKKVIPPTWKWSLSVKHHSSLVLTIAAGPQELAFSPRTRQIETERSLNPYYLDKEFRSPELIATFEKIGKAMNTDNHDNSDLMTDYFDVGHYVHINIGKWDKPFVALA